MEEMMSFTPASPAFLPATQIYWKPYQHHWMDTEVTCFSHLDICVFFKLKSEASTSTCLSRLNDWIYTRSLRNASASMKENPALGALSNLSNSRSLILVIIKRLVSNTVDLPRLKILPLFWLIVSPLSKILHYSAHTCPLRFLPKRYHQPDHTKFLSRRSSSVAQIVHLNLVLPSLGLFLSPWQAQLKPQLTCRQTSSTYDKHIGICIFTCKSMESFFIIRIFLRISPL